MHALCTAYPKALYSAEGSWECLAGKGSHMGNSHYYGFSIVGAGLGELYEKPRGAM